MEEHEHVFLTGPWVQLLTWLQVILCFGYQSTWSSPSTESLRMRCALYRFDIAIPLHRGGHTRNPAAPLCLRGVLCVWPLSWLFNHPPHALLFLQALSQVLLWC